MAKTEAPAALVSLAAVRDFAAARLVGEEGWDAARAEEWADEFCEEVAGRHPGARALAAGTVEGLPGVVALSEVEPERVEWLWPSRIPLGRLTLLDGDPGLGKSALTADLAARVTTGGRMPDGALGLTTPRGVVLLAAEDGLADTVRPRLDAAGADVERVVALQWVSARTVDGEPGRRLPTVQDVGEIEDAIRAVDAAIVVVDPLVAYMGPVDSHRDAEVRGGLAELSELAERTGVAILAVRHLRKSGGSPLYAGGGSIAFIAAARSGLLLAADPDDPEGDRRILAPTKANLCRRPPSLALRLVGVRDGVVRVSWEGESAHDAHALLERLQPEERSAREEAEEWLREALASGPRASKDVQREARAEGIAASTLRRARERLGVEVERHGFGADGGWTWRLQKAPSSKDDHGGEHLWEGAEVVTNGESQEGRGVSGDGAPIDAQTRALDIYGENEAPATTCASGCGKPVGRAGVECAKCRYGGGEP